MKYTQISPLTFLGKKMLLIDSHGNAMPCKCAAAATFFVWPASPFIKNTSATDIAGQIRTPARLDCVL
jgi:hypothetical protein